MEFIVISSKDVIQTSNLFDALFGEAIETSPSSWGSAYDKLK